MILSSDELEILEYLKSFKETSVPMNEISRCAGGRQKFRESPNWARNLMSRLVESKLVKVNDRGYYQIVVEEEVAPPKRKNTATRKAKESHQVDDNYFPAAMEEPIIEIITGIIGEDYFPSTAETE